MSFIVRLGTKFRLSLHVNRQPQVSLFASSLRYHRHLSTADVTCLPEEQTVKRASDTINVVLVGGEAPRFDEPRDWSGFHSREDEHGMIKVDLRPEVTPLNIFRGTTLNVTDMVVPYCELKRLYSYCVPIPESEDSIEAKAKGTAVHADLEKTADAQLLGEQVVLDTSLIQTREEAWAVKLLDQKVRQYTLLSSPNATIRELYVFGCLDGRMVTGYIDHISLDEDGRMVLQETKTRRGSSFPAKSAQISAYQQLLVYHELLQQMIDDPYGYYKPFYKGREIDEYRDFSPKFAETVGHTNLHSIHLQFSLHWPKLSDKLIVNYMRSDARNFGQPLGSIEFDFDKNLFTMLKDYSFSYWEGARPPVGVAPDELGKCGHCEFRSKCSWYSELTKLG